MLPRYDAVVIGTGFGGAVAACRLSQAGLSVGVLERGRRYPRGTFPRNWHDPLDGWLYSHDQGLFDIRPTNEMTIVQGAAYGGGSHLYANVHLRMPADAFDGWPAGLDRAALDPYYDLVAAMLDLRAIDEQQPLAVPPKTGLMAAVADRLGRTDQFLRPTLAVRFTKPDGSTPNRFEVLQGGCIHCGECDVGCNEQAKNTLDLNYLAVAERNGADVGTRCEVTGIAAAGDGYEVRFRDHAAGRAEVVRARTVVLAAGAVRSTELLLRCRDELGTLPRLSPALGTRYSGNGDFLAFAMDTSDDFDPHVGPVITSAMLYDRGTGPDRQWFLFQEGGFPRQVAKLVRLLDDRLLDAVRGLPRAPDDVLAGIRRAARGVDLDPADEDRRMGVFLVMGRDSGTGRIELARGSGELRVKWDLSANLALYETQQRFCADVAHALGGRLALNPMWQWLRLPVSVHNLGGCAMADDPAKGVTDGFGQAHGHPGLYVLDGGSLPSPTGVNPAHTIAAVAERNIEAAIRAITGVAGWSAPERRGAAAVDDPLARVVVPPGGTPAPSTPGVGLVYREYLSGRIDGVTGAVRAELEVAAPSVVEMLADDAHRLVVSGRLWVPGFTGPPGARIGNGMVNLLVPGERPGARRVLYALPFFGPDGSHYLLDARKELPENGRLDLWDDATTIRFTIRRGHVAEGDPLAGGSLRQSVSSLVRQLVSTRVTGTGSPLRKSEALVRHGRFLGGALASAYLTAGLGRTTT